MATTILTYQDFIKVHELLLTAAGIPPSLYRKLYEKLSSEAFDGGEYFQVEPVEDGRQRRLVMTSSEWMRSESNVFLVDHALSFRLSDAPKQLQEVPGLVQRMASLMCVDIDLNSDSEEAGDESGDSKLSVVEIVEREYQKVKKEGPGAVVWLELEDLDIDDDVFLSLDLPSKFPDLIALSLCDNKLKVADTIINEIGKFKHLKALWLNNNPILQNSDDYVAANIIQNCPSLEILNSSFTRKYTGWALGFCGGIYDQENPGCGHDNEHSLRGLTSLDLSNRRIHSLLNKGFSPDAMPSLNYLNLKGNPLDDHSLSDLRKLLEAFTSLHALEVDIPGPLGDSAVEIAESIPRISVLNGVNTARIIESGKSVIDSTLLPRLPEWTTGEPLLDRVLNAMWLYLMSYRLADEEKIDETSIWYVMDELGSALRHSDLPNFRVAPFLYMPDGKLESAVSFTILWPTKDIQSGDECTRDYLFGIGEEKQRSARLTAWFHTPQKYFIKEYENYWQNMRLTSSSSVNNASSTSSVKRGDGLPLRVYTDLPPVEEYLTHPSFILTNDPKEADIIWTCMQVDEETRKAIGLNDQQIINQFPFEACLVMKHHLAETVQKAYGSCEWFQPTYNLETQLTQFIGDYYVRENNKTDNLWILKPWNMARTIDTTVTGNLSAIIRLMETGPKICQKYIEQPALFRGKKFDLRYIVLVRSINPLELFITDVFWVRLANNTYTLDKKSLFEYETHFTVMNYRGTLNHMNTPEFVKEFEQEHQVKWSDIHSRVKQMIRKVFESAALVHPEMHSPMSRAMYGVDVMLDSSFKPKLLEVTYCPDCTRACKYDMEAIMGGGETVKGQDFYNYIFACLFLNETTHVTPL
ncbi:tubulin-tyrosine ligase [Artemisia annua]|uniref:Tubulin-tyrosine ligase n=1 Tax=Artemisia annua TaxID=35608 RepID=A0A2U1P034_ARTAN|nr:tubulin-tyrosine ligase [Artemisia annua]